MAKHDDLYKAKDSLEKNLREVNKFLAADKVAKNRESSRVYAREQSIVEREIGGIPDVKDWPRRKASEYDLRQHLETYNSFEFELSWSKAHLLLLDSLQRAILEGLLQLIVFPRGSGKTSIARRCVEWGTLHGHISFPMLFGAEDSKAKQHLSAIKADLLKNDLLNDDFPEICFPIRKTEGIANRANYQTCRWKPTEMKWGTQIIYPTVDESIERKNAGAIIGVGTITGSSARGPLVNNKRPDFALIDDPQTRSSAKSPQQCVDRGQIVSGDIMGMSGPNKRIAAVMTGTVIYKNDLIEEFLDRQEHPEWHGIKVSMLSSLPKNLGKWDDWWDIMRRCLDEERPTTEAHDFYKANREEMIEGADHYWEERITPGFVDCYESAMALFYRDRSTFASEFQNDPLDTIDNEAGMPVFDDLNKRVSPIKRRTIPEWTERRTAFIDVQKKLLYHLSCAWKHDFTGCVIDYNSWPDQRRQYYTLKDAKRTIFQRKPGAGYEGALYHALNEVMDEIEQMDDAMPLERGMVDANYAESRDIVLRVCRERKGGIWLPSFGIGHGATRKPFGERTRRPGDQIGLNWRMPGVGKQHRQRQVQYETNYWKAFAAERLRVAVGDPGSLVVFESRSHRLLWEQLHAEYATLVEAEGRQVLQWSLKPGNPDNHFLDCLVGNCVAASMLGCAVAGAGGEPSRKRKRVRLSELSNK